MKFRYVSYEVDASPTVPNGILYRPEIPLDVGGARRMESIQALVDTGSDETVFPISLAESIGARLEHGLPNFASAVGGHAVRLIPGIVSLQIAQKNKTYRWETTVSFLEVDKPDEEVALLGYSGFLEYFLASFDSQNHELDLTPNDRFLQRKQA